MSKSKKTKTSHIAMLSRQGILAFSMVFLMAFSVAGFSVVQADQFEAKIKELEKQNDKKEAVQDNLLGEAESLSGAIAKLQNEISAKQRAIVSHQKEVVKLKKEIADAQIELDKQKKLLSETIRAIYVEGDISTVEMLASSDDLADFFDKQQYRESVHNQIKVTLDKVNQLKLDLSTKKNKTEKLLNEQTNLKNQLLSQRSEKNRLLSLNESERSKLDSSIRQNSKKIAELRRQQVIANARFSGGSVNVPDTTGYPWANFQGGGWTHGGSCYYSGDPDPWGMCKRQCVSYAAWKVYKAKGYMPHWGGNYSNGYRGGNAKEWPHNAGIDRIRVDSNPGRGNDGTVAVSSSGTWGHVMYVEAVHGNGTITISQYNVSLTGKYSVATISSSGLQFIHF